MHHLTLLAITLITSTVFAVPTSTPYAIHEKREFLPMQWEKRSKAQPDTKLSMRIGLTQRNLDLGPQHLADTFSPTSPNYGKHWTAKQVAEYFAPEDDTVVAVQSWLKGAGINHSRQSFTSGWITFDASVEEAEVLLNTEYHLFQHSVTAEYHVGCDQYSVPTGLRNHIDLITPTIGFSTKAKDKLLDRTSQRSRLSNLPRDLTPRAFTGALQGCAQNVTPSCIKALYNIPPNIKPQASNSLGIYEESQSYDQADLNTFFTKYATNIPANTGPILDLIAGAAGPVSQSLAGTETMFDLDVAYPLVYPQNITLLQTNQSFDSLLGSLDASYCPNNPACGIYKAPNVISISYDDQEATSSSGFAASIRQCNEFMKLGLQGVSVLVPSGDHGVGPTCGTDGSFFIRFPSSCPYVTTVGATMINPSRSNGNPEQAASSTYNLGITSGGGFSNIFARPSYQQSAVSNYLTNYPPGYPSSYYNASGRAFPDVSANGAFIQTFINGKWASYDGTSASVPLFASIITLINENRLAAGKSPVGFLNPTLYAHPDAFTDIVRSNNPGCNTNGFNATVGWDPATGLGTPVYDCLLDIFMALQ